MVINALSACKACNADRSRYCLRKYFFTNRALDVWNSLPNHVVLCDTVNTCKSNQT